MEIYCKRTLFAKDDKVVYCKKGKIYKTQAPTTFELKSGLCLWVEIELITTGRFSCYTGHSKRQTPTSGNWYPLTLKIFEKYFTTIDEMRNNKIDEIIK